jgi:hypothetical protein
LQPFTGAPLGADFHFDAFLRICRAVRRIRSTPPKAPRGPALGRVETRARVASAAVPSRELPTFNGLYPSIVARQLSQ